MPLRVLPFTAFLLLSFLCQLAVAQKQPGYLAIGNKQIHFTWKEKVWVQRTIWDTVVSCKGHELKDIPINSKSISTWVEPAEVKKLHRQIFNENGCVWTRLTNDVVAENEKPRLNIVLVKDSATTVKFPADCFTDTVYQINPITLEEEEVIQKYTQATVLYNLGKVSRKDLVDALLNQLSVAKSGANYSVDLLKLKFFDDHTCGTAVFTFEKKNWRSEVVRLINESKDETTFVIEQVAVTDSNDGQMYYLWDLATLKMID